MRWFTVTGLVLSVAVAGFGCKQKPDSDVTAAQASAPLREKAPPPELAVSDPAPRITMTLEDGRKVTTADYAGKYLLVYFYPQDDTPGCTAQAKGLKESEKTLAAFDVEILGVSTQDAASHRAFIEKYELPFSLVVDVDGKVAEAFGVPLKSQRALRHSFLVGPEGTIVQIWRNVDAGGHAREVLGFLANN